MFEGLRKFRERFGSVFPRKYDLERHIEDLYARLAEIRDLQLLAEHPSWMKAQRVLLQYVEHYEKTIVGLSGDPATHGDEMRQLKAMRDAIVILIFIFEELPEESDKIKEALDKRLAILKATTDFPRPSEEDNLEEERPPQ